MSTDIEAICNIAGCTQAEAAEAYMKTGTIVDAVDLLFVKPACQGDKYTAPKQKKMTDEQAIFNELRDTMKKFDEEVTSLSQSSSCAGVGMQVLPEEMVQQSNCSQICQLPSLEEEAQTPETACPLQSE